MRTADALTVLMAAALFGLAPVSAPALRAAEKLTLEDRIELTRGLMAEYGKAKVLVPRSKKNLALNSDGTYNKTEWSAIAKESGPAARVGDMIQITKVDIGGDRIILQLNGGFKGGQHWYHGVSIGMGGSNAPAQVPVGSDANAPGGTAIEVLFHKPLEPIKATEVKKMLAAVLDFDQHSATEIFSDTLPPETKKAIAEKRVLEGMTHDQVVLAMGRPAHKSRESKDGLDTEDWVYGVAPGKITFVTFSGDKVIKVKEMYAGLGTEVQGPAIIHE
jgi:hypothetical protein